MLCAAQAGSPRDTLLGVGHVMCAGHFVRMRDGH